MEKKSFVFTSLDFKAHVTVGCMILPLFLFNVAAAKDDLGVTTFDQLY